MRAFYGQTISLRIQQSTWLSEMVSLLRPGSDSCSTDLVGVVCLFCKVQICTATRMADTAKTANMTMANAVTPTAANK